jgi:hypothetical protein
MKVREKEKVHISDQPAPYVSNIKPGVEMLPGFIAIVAININQGNFWAKIAGTAGERLVKPVTVAMVSRQCRPLVFMYIYKNV